MVKMHEPILILSPPLPSCTMSLPLQVVSVPLSSCAAAEMTVRLMPNIAITADNVAFLNRLRKRKLTAICAPCPAPQVDRQCLPRSSTRNSLSSGLCRDRECRALYPSGWHFPRRLASYPLPQIKKLVIPVGESSLQSVVILEQPPRNQV